MIQQIMKNKTNELEEVFDGSQIKEFVENKPVFGTYVDHKFDVLDKDGDGCLSVKELAPAVADIGLAIGLPPKGSPDSDHVYSEVLNEFTHGKQTKVSKEEFKEVLSDVLLGVASGLKRDPVVVLRMDGEDLLEFIHNPSYEADMMSICSQLDFHTMSLQDCSITALDKLTVNQGMPPSSDVWVVKTIIEPALQLCSNEDRLDSFRNQPLSQETFLVEFNKILECVAHHLKLQPVIVAHTENMFDGTGIERLLGNNAELNKVLNEVVDNMPTDRHHKFPREYLHMALDAMAPSACLPPLGAVNEIDSILEDALKVSEYDDKKLLKKEEFKKILTQVLGSIMLQLKSNPVAVSSNVVIHEPLDASSSTLLDPSC